MIAYFVKKADNMKTDARVYRLEPAWHPPLADADDTAADVEYIVVSGLNHAFDTGQPETYIFPADADGRVLDWGELPGSFRGGVDHNKALRDFGCDAVR